MQRIILIFFSAVIFYCCTQKESTLPAAAVTYEMANFRIESEGGCRADTARCASYEVSYPVFHGIDSVVLKILSKRIDEKVTMGNPEAEGETMQQIGKKFVNDFDDLKKEMPDAFGWYYSAVVSVEVLTDTLLSLSVSDEYFTGGAHGGHGKYFININPKTGADFTLDNYLQSGYGDALRTIGERVFRKEHELADTASLERNMFEFQNDRFELNRNYGFTADGILFYYNSYEIAAYAMGPSPVLIPYDSIKRLAKQR